MSDRSGLELLGLVSGGASNPVVVSGTAAPTTGVDQPEGSIYLRFVAAGGELWVKTGSAATAWTDVTAGGGGGGGLWTPLERITPINASSTMTFTTTLALNSNFKYRLDYHVMHTGGGAVTRRLIAILNSDVATTQLSTVNSGSTGGMGGATDPSRIALTTAAARDQAFGEWYLSKRVASADTWAGGRANQVEGPVAAANLAKQVSASGFDSSADITTLRLAWVDGSAVIQNEWDTDSWALLSVLATAPISGAV